MDDNDPLCCCEYFNPITNERDHLLLACCDFSECFTECFQRFELRLDEIIYLGHSLSIFLHIHQIIQLPVSVCL